MEGILNGSIFILDAAKVYFP